MRTWIQALDVPPYEAGRMALDARFGRLWTATIASNLGDGLVAAAFPLLAASITRSPTAIAGLTVAMGLPWLVLGPFAGAIVDRHDRRRAMIAFDVGRGCVVAALALLVLVGTGSILALYAAVVLIGVGETIVDTSSQAMLPALVERRDLERANARLFATQTVAQRFVGPPLGGYLFAVAATVPIFTDAVSFLLAAFVVATIPGGFGPVRADASAATSIRADTLEGLRWLWRHGPIRAFAIGAAVLNVAITAGEAILVLFAQEILHVSGIGFGLLLAATAAGYTAGAAAAPRVVGRIGRRTVVLASVGALAGALAVVAAGILLPTIVALAVVGVASGLWDVIAVSYRQAAVPDRLMGRIMAAYRFVAYGAFPIGALLGGAIADAAGIRLPFVFGAVLALLLVPFLWMALSGVELDPARARPEQLAG
jgi:MFS family permease